VIYGKPAGGGNFMDVSGKILNGTEYKITDHDVIEKNDQGKDADKAQNKPVNPHKDAAVNFRKTGDFRQQEAEYDDYQGYNGKQRNAKGKNNLIPQG
jgi:hypothetical protein